MNETAEVPGWTGLLRSDGAQVWQLKNSYVIRSPTGDMRNKCPCCGGFMLSARVAKIAANLEFPMKEPS
jgi:hypothetical protein